MAKKNFQLCLHQFPIAHSFISFISLFESNHFMHQLMKVRESLACCFPLLPLIFERGERRERRKYPIRSSFLLLHEEEEKLFLGWLEPFLLTKDHHHNLISRAAAIVIMPSSQKGQMRQITKDSRPFSPQAAFAQKVLEVFERTL